MKLSELQSLVDEFLWPPYAKAEARHGVYGPEFRIVVQMEEGAPLVMKLLVEDETPDWLRAWLAGSVQKAHDAWRYGVPHGRVVRIDRVAKTITLEVDEVSLDLAEIGMRMVTS